MPPAGFESAIPGSERLQSHALDCAATAIGQTGGLGKVITGVFSNLHWRTANLQTLHFKYLLNKYNY